MIITVKIDHIAATAITVATTVITVRTVRMSETHALSARNQIIVPRSIHRRNKTLKRHDLRLETLVDLAIRCATPVTLISTLLVYTYSMWPKLKVKTI
jgi:hypothetical protein